MKHSYFSRILALAAAAIGLSANAEINLSYYSSLDGKCGAELKTAVYELVNKNVNMLSYGSGSTSTWAGFYECDQLSDGEVVDRYSQDHHYFGSKGSSVSGMNIEHSFPKSWWGGSTNNAYKDLYNLMPCESKINSTKSNYPMGTVVGSDSGNGFTKVGKGSDNQYYWEPADQWKGDFARGYMYMATAYQNLTWASASPQRALLILENNTYPTLKPAASKLFIQWAKEDPVTEDEITRNDIVETLQGNRNPFNDFPNLMEYIWGDSITTPFNVLTTKKGGLTSGDPLVELYSNTFLGDEGDCTVEISVKPTKPANVWVNTSDYGWKASAYSGSSYASDESLVLPEIDLTYITRATLSFSHAVNKVSTSAPSDILYIIVRDEKGNETVINDRAKWPTGSYWTFSDNKNISLNDFSGHRIRILFRYTSTADEACTWEIKNLTISGRQYSGVEFQFSPSVDNTDYPIEYFSIDGRRVNPDTFHGLVIRCQGSQATKMILK